MPEFEAKNVNEFLLLFVAGVVAAVIIALLARFTGGMLV